MVSKDMLHGTLESTLKVLEDALREREEALRALCGACNVSSYDDIEDFQLWKIGSDLDGQVDDLKDLIDDIKRAISRVFTYRNV